MIKALGWLASRLMPLGGADLEIPLPNSRADVAKGSLPARRKAARHQDLGHPQRAGPFAGASEPPTLPQVPAKRQAETRQSATHLPLVNVRSAQKQ